MISYIMCIFQQKLDSILAYTNSYVIVSLFYHSLTN